MEKSINQNLRVRKQVVFTKQLVDQFGHWDFGRGEKKSQTTIWSQIISGMWVKFAQSFPTLCNPMDYTVHGILHARILEWGAFFFSRGSSQPRDRTQVSHMAGKFFTRWTTAKPKNAGVGSLSLLQWIFPSQESNQGLLHCRQILYQLSYQGSPISSIM